MSESPGRDQRVTRRALRRLVVELHLWVGLTAGLVVSIVGLTGSLYVFAPEITRALHADVWRIPADARRLSDAEVVRRVEASTGAQIESVQWPQRGRDVWWMKLAGQPAWIFVDPRTGEVLARDRDLWAVRAFEWILEVHTSLTAGDIGYLITGGASLLLAVVLVSSGLYLWWPRTRATRARSFSVRWRGSTTRRRLFDLHNVPGMYASVLMVLLGLTGATWAFPALANVVAEVTTVSPVEEAVPAEPRSSAAAGRRALSLTDVLARSDSLFPGYARRNLWMTDDSTGTVYMSWIRSRNITAGGEYRPMAWLDRYSGRPVSVYDPVTATRATRLLNVWVPPIHFGEVGGMPTRILAFLAGLMPLALWITGAALWWNRRAAVRRRPHFAVASVRWRRSEFGQGSAAESEPVRRVLETRAHALPAHSQVAEVRDRPWTNPEREGAPAPGAGLHVVDDQRRL